MEQCGHGSRISEGGGLCVDEQGVERGYGFLVGVWGDDVG